MAESEGNVSVEEHKTRDHPPPQLQTTIITATAHYFYHKRSLPQPQLPPTHSPDIKQMAQPSLEATIEVDPAVVCANAHPPSRPPAHEAAAGCS